MATNKDKIRAAAQKYLQKGQIEKAIREFSRLVEADPKDVRTLLKIGDLQTRNGDYDEAVTTYGRVAEFYSKQGFYLKAVAVYKQILKLQPTLVEHNQRLAELYQQLGLVSDATNQYRQIAQIYEKQGDLDRSLDVLRRMVDLDPENVASRIKLAELNAKQGRREEARADFHKAAAFLKGQHRVEDYIKVAERIVHFDPEDLDTARELADIYIHQGDARRALAKLQACFRANPKDPETLQLLAEAFKTLGQTQKTLSVYHELLKIFSSKGDTAAIARIARKALQVDPEDAIAKRAVDDLGQSAAPADANSGPGTGEDASAESLGRIKPGQRAIRPPSEVTERLPGAVDPRSDDISTDVAKADDADAETVTKLLVEVDIYIKYDLRAKAVDHLRRILELDPNHLEALGKQKDLLLQVDDRQGATEVLNQIVKVSREAGKNGVVDKALAELKQLDSASELPAVSVGLTEPAGIEVEIDDGPEVEVEIDLDDGGIEADIDSEDSSHESERESGVGQANGDLPGDGFEVEVDEIELADSGGDANDVAAADELDGGVDVEVELELDVEFGDDSLTDLTAGQAVGEGHTEAEFDDGFEVEIEVDAAEAEGVEVDGAEAEGVEIKLDESDTDVEVDLEDDADLVADVEVAAEDDSEIDVEASGADEMEVDVELDADDELSADIELSDEEIDADVGVEIELDEADELSLEVAEDDESEIELEAVEDDDESIAVESGEGEVTFGASEQAPRQPDSRGQLEIASGESEVSFGEGAKAVVTAPEAVADQAPQEPKSQPLETPSSDVAAGTTADILQAAPAKPAVSATAASGLAGLTGLADIDDLIQGAVPARRKTSEAPAVSAPRKSVSDSPSTLEAEPKDAKTSVASSMASVPSVSGSDANHESSELASETATASPAAASPQAPSASPAAEEAAVADEGIDEDLEEAAFLFEQGLIEDTQAIADRIRELSPQHPGLQLLDDKLAAQKAPAPFEPEPTADAAATGEETLDLAGDLAGDLASELAADLDEAAGDDFQISFTDVFDEFKKGVAEQVEDTDYDTHYDLGIAYREMGLLSDAAREFEMAMRSPDKHISALTMLGLCRLQEGDSIEALKIFQQGLTSEKLNPAEVVALRYEIGSAYEAMGRLVDARRFFEKARSLDPAFRDVSARVRDIDRMTPGGETDEAEVDHDLDELLEDPVPGSGQSKISYI